MMPRADATPLQIVLTEPEEALYRSIDEGAEGPQAWAANGRRIRTLLKGLEARGALPEIRLRYFKDPDLNVGGHGSSREGWMERNGCGDDLWAHPSFIKYLKYFVEGPELPSAVIASFQEAASAPFREWGDLHSLVRKEAAAVRFTSAPSVGEEFFKLALECDLPEYEARQLRDAARNAARARASQR